MIAFAMIANDCVKCHNHIPVCFTVILQSAAEYLKDNFEDKDNVNMSSSNSKLLSVCKD